MSIAVERKIVQVSYSKLVTESSTRVISGQGERKLKSVCPQLRKEALDQNKIKYSKDDNLEEVVVKLVEKVKQLPADTIFTVGNLVLSPDQKTASKLGRMFRSKCRCCVNC